MKKLTGLKIVYKNFTQIDKLPLNREASKRTKSLPAFENFTTFVFGAKQKTKSAYSFRE